MIWLLLLSLVISMSTLIWSILELVKCMVEAKKVDYFGEEE